MLGKLLQCYSEAADYRLQVTNMARNGNGIFNLPAGNPVAPDTTIESTWANATMGEIATAISNSIANDGQTTIVANLKMSGFRHTGVGNPTARDQYLSLAIQQDGTTNRLTGITGVNDLVGTMLGSPPSYSPGMEISFFAPATNTGAMTIAVGALGAKSLVDSFEDPLLAGDIISGEFYKAYYDGAKFVLLTTVESPQSRLWETAPTGEDRPLDGTYDPITIVNAATGAITIPAGSGVITPPESAYGNTAQRISWGNLSYTLPTMAGVACSVVGVRLVGSTPTAVQFTGQPSPADYKTTIMVAVIHHPKGTITGHTLTPRIMYGETYRNLDVTNRVQNTITSGAKISSSSATALQITGGTIDYVGANSTNSNAPNEITVSAVNPIPFYTLAGSSSVSASTFTSISSTDGAAAIQAQYWNGSALATIASSTNAVIHRLYYSFGTYFWAYGTKVYADFDTAVANLAADRSLWSHPVYLANSTLLGEVIVTKTGSLAVATEGLVVPAGAGQSNFFTPLGGDAPSDGKYYGRYNASWQQVVSAAAALFTTSDVKLDKDDGFYCVYDNSSAGSGGGGLAIYKGLSTGSPKLWAKIWIDGTTGAEGTLKIQGYNPATGSLSNTISFDISTGDISFPSDVSAVGDLTADDATFESLGVTNEVSTTDLYATGISVLGTVTSKAIAATGGPTAYVVNTSTSFAPYDGLIIEVDFSSAIINNSIFPTINFNSSGAKSIHSYPAVTIDVMPNSLIGVQRFQYNSALSSWIAIDQTTHFMNEVASDIKPEVGHTYAYYANGVNNFPLRLIFGLGEAYSIVTSSLTQTTTDGIVLTPSTLSSASFRQYGNLWSSSPGSQTPTPFAYNANGQPSMYMGTGVGENSIHGTLTNSSVGRVALQIKNDSTDGSTAFSGSCLTHGVLSSSPYTATISKASGTMTGWFNITRLS